VYGPYLLQPTETKTRGEFKEQIRACIYIYIEPILHIYIYIYLFIYLYIIYTYYMHIFTYTMGTWFFPRIKRPGRI